MSMRDLYSNLAVSQILAPATLTADANSAAVDLQGFDSVLLIVNVGASGDTLSGSVKIELEVEESDDNSTWSDVADEDLLKSVSGTNGGCFAVIDAADEDDAVYFTGYIGTKRYVRVAVNVTGTHTNGTPISATAIRGHAHLKPVNT